MLHASKKQHEVAVAFFHSYAVHNLLLHALLASNVDVSQKSKNKDSVVEASLQKLPQFIMEVHPIKSPNNNRTNLFSHSCA